MPASAGNLREPGGRRARTRTPRAPCGFPRPPGGAGRGSWRCSGGSSSRGGSSLTLLAAPVRPSHRSSAARGPGARPASRRAAGRSPGSPMGLQHPLTPAAAALLWGFLLPLVKGTGGLSGLPGAGPGPPHLRRHRPPRPPPSPPPRAPCRPALSRAYAACSGFLLSSPSLSHYSLSVQPPFPSFEVPVPTPEKATCRAPNTTRTSVLLLYSFSLFQAF